MPALKDVARHVRSKNAGPFWVTIDVFCDTAEAYGRLEMAASLRPMAIAELYGVVADEVRIFPDQTLKAIKISFPRPIVAGGLRDRDAHAGQYFVPLLAAPVD